MRLGTLGRLAAALILQSVTFGMAQAADLVKIGLLNTSGDIAVHIANERGYFRQENIEPELIVFDASAPRMRGVAP